MATWDDVRRIALALPETTEGSGRGNAQWKVRDKLFVWERPLRAPDLEALGPDAPTGEILGVRVEHLGVKDVLIGSAPDVFFTTPHFDNYPAVLAQLDSLTPDELEEVVTEAWLARAPKRVAQAWLEEHGE